MRAVLKYSIYYKVTSGALIQGLSQSRLTLRGDCGEISENFPMLSFPDIL